VARQPPCVVRPQTFCADEGLPETTTESSPRLGHVSVRFSVVFQSAMNASATVLHINALRLLHCPDIMLPFGRMLGGVPVARLTGSDEVRFSAAVDFNPQIHSPAGESSVHTFPQGTYKPGVSHLFPTVPTAQTETLLSVPKFACKRWRPPGPYYDWKEVGNRGAKTYIRH
jgi:hypothetical protein